MNYAEQEVWLGAQKRAECLSKHDLTTLTIGSLAEKVARSYSDRKDQDLAFFAAVPIVEERKKQIGEKG